MVLVCLCLICNGYEHLVKMMQEKCPFLVHFFFFQACDSCTAAAVQSFYCICRLVAKLERCLGGGAADRKGEESSDNVVTDLSYCAKQ